MPGHTHLTDLEQLLLLAVLRFENEAYGASLQADIEDVADRHVSLGSIHMTLGRLEERGPGPLGEVGSAAQPRRQGSTYLPGHREGPGGTRVEPPRDRPDVGWRAGGRPAVNPLPLGLGALLRALLPHEFADHVVTELEERYADRRLTGRISAALWLAREVAMTPGRAHPFRRSRGRGGRPWRRGYRRGEPPWWIQQGS